MIDTRSRSMDFTIFNILGGYHLEGSKTLKCFGGGRSHCLGNYEAAEVIFNAM